MFPTDADDPRTPDMPALPAPQPDGDQSALVPADAPGQEIIEAAPGPAAPFAGQHRAALPTVLTAGPTLAALMRALRRRWALALGLAALFAGLVAFVTWRFIAPAKYTAQALLRVDSKVPAILFDAKEAVDYPTYQRTQIVLIKSRFVLNAALDSPKVKDLEIVRRQPHPIDWLVKELEVDFLPGSEVLRISLGGDQPRELAALVNAVTDAYVREVVDWEKNLRMDRLERLKEIYEKHDRVLRERRRTMEQMARDAGGANGQAMLLQQKAALEQITGAHQQLLELRIKLQKLRAETEILQSMPKDATEVAMNDPALESLFLRDPDVKKQLEKVGRLESKLQVIKRVAADPAGRRVKDAETLVKDARAQLDALKKKLYPALAKEVRARNAGGRHADVSRLKVETTVLEKTEVMLNKEIQRLSELAGKNTRQTLNLESVREEIDLASAMARRMGEERAKLEVESDAPPRIRLLEKAEPPQTKDKGRQGKVAAMAGAGTFLLVLFGVALCEFRSRRISSTDEVVRGLGLRVVGAVPALPGRGRPRLLGGRTARDPYWQHLMTESVDAARTMLLHAARTHGLKVVMVTSALPGEGKTSLTSQLATSLARAGRKTLLIDCDLRKPAVHRLLGLPLEGGVSDVLRNEADLAEVIRPTEAPNLWFVSAGECDAEALRALAQPDLQALFDLLREQYDFILVDTSPVLCVADALLLGQYVDGALFSILRHVSRLPTVHAAAEKLQMLDVPVLGAVVSGVSGTVYGSSYHYVSRSGE